MTTRFKYLTLFLSCLLTLFIHAQAVSASLGSDTPLRVDEAYQLSVFSSIEGDKEAGTASHLIEFYIEPGYYLYKDKFSVIPQPLSIEASDNIASITDEFFGEQDIYRNFARFTLEMPQVASAKFVVNYQGCWEQGLCYPVQSRLIKIVDGLAKITPIAFADADTLSSEGDINYLPEVAGEGDIGDAEYLVENSHQFYLNNLRGSSTALIILLFFIAGLGLTFTPCVLPMLPIISGIVTRKQAKDSTQWSRLSLALTYVVVMSLMFSLLGLFSGLIGSGLRDLLGSQIFLLTMTSLITLMGLSMLNLVRIPLPEFIGTPVQNYLDSDTGAYSKAAAWGFLSPFIAGTCLSAPLAGALIYLAEQGNPWFGVWSLLALGWGMGLPLLLFAAGLGQFMPSSGPWLEVFRNILGLTLLGLAVFIISPLLPSYIEVFGYILVLAAMLYLLVVSLLRRWVKAQVTSRVASKAAAIGVILLALIAGVFYINYTNQQEKLEFQVVDNYDSMQELLKTSATTNTPQLLYYYADWCISCRELEWVVFGDDEVQQKLSEINFTKLDITKASEDTRLMTEYFAIIGPPTIIFVDAEGKYREELTLIGNFDKPSFIKRLESLVN